MSYSRKVRKVHAEQGGRVVYITVEVGVRDHSLTRDEHDTMMDDVVSGIMRALPTVQYLNVPLSRVKVSR